MNKETKTYKHQSEFRTKIAEEAIKENKLTKQSKKERIKKILAEVGYDPKKHYTSKEKRKFTRIVKNKLFTKPKVVSLTKEEILSHIEVKKKVKAMAFANLPYVPLPCTKGKQRSPSVAEINIKEKPEARKFRYVVNRRRSDDPMRCYDFKTDYFNASTQEEAKKKAAKIAKEYKLDKSFAGITVKDIEKTNDIIYYDGKALLAA